jgi:hypothetical protein
MALRPVAEVGMARKRPAAEEIVGELRQVDLLVGQGKPVAEAVRRIGVTALAYDRWRSEQGGLKGDQVERLQELAAEHRRRRRAVSELTPDTMILAEAARGNCRAPPVARACVEHVVAELGVPAGFSGLGSRASKRSTQRQPPSAPDGEVGPTADITARATQKPPENGAAPSNIIDHGYPIGALNLAGSTPIILPVDGPGMGGFINPYTVATAASWKLAQARPGDRLRFLAVDVEAAQALARALKERCGEDAIV